MRMRKCIAVLMLGGLLLAEGCGNNSEVSKNNTDKISENNQSSENVSEEGAYNKGEKTYNINYYHELIDKLMEDDSKLNDLYDKYLLLDEEVNLEKIILTIQ